MLWSTGFVVARYATRDAGPFTFLAGRTAIAAVVLAAAAAIQGAARPSWRAAGWAALAALGIHVLYLGGVFWAIDRGLPSGLSALIAGLHPVLTAVVGHRFLAERLRRVQVVGVALGLCGVVLVVGERLGSGVGAVELGPLVAMVIAVVGMSGGTLVQRARSVQMPLLWGAAAQYAASAIVFTAVAVVAPGERLELTAQFALSLAWAVGVLSIASVLLLLWLLSRQAAGSVASLFFLTPGLSAVEAAVLFGEELGALALVGMAVALLGVALTTRT